jgi:hypothetical protein
MNVHRTDRWQTVSFTSEALRGNPLGDPHIRPLHVYVPTTRLGATRPCT